MTRDLSRRSRVCFITRVRDDVACVAWLSGEGEGRGGGTGASARAGRGMGRGGGGGGREGEPAVKPPKSSFFLTHSERKIPIGQYASTVNQR